jgi:hypothetical protein
MSFSKLPENGPNMGDFEEIGISDGAGEVEIGKKNQGKSRKKSKNLPK